MTRDYFQCKHCGIVFYTEKSLKYHLLDEEGYEPKELGLKKHKLKKMS